MRVEEVSVHKSVLLIALIMPMVASAGGVNKCVGSTRVIYTDKPCPPDTKDGRISAAVTSYGGQEAHQRNVAGNASVAARNAAVAAPARPPPAAAAGGSQQSTYGATVANVRRVEQAVKH